MIDLRVMIIICSNVIHREELDRLISNLIQRIILTIGAQLFDLFKLQDGNLPAN